MPRSRRDSAGATARPATTETTAHAARILRTIIAPPRQISNETPVRSRSHGTPRAVASAGPTRLACGAPTSCSGKHACPRSQYSLQNATRGPRLAVPIRLQSGRATSGTAPNNATFAPAWSSKPALAQPRRCCRASTSPTSFSSATCQIHSVSLDGYSAPRDKKAAARAEPR